MAQLCHYLYLTHYGSTSGLSTDVWQQSYRPVENCMVSSLDLTLGTLHRHYEPVYFLDLQVIIR